MRDVVSAASESMQTILLDRTFEMLVALPDEPLIVHGDAAQLHPGRRQPAQNAVKFTDDDGEVRCRLTQCDGDAVLEISDNGVGIPRAEQQTSSTASSGPRPRTSGRPRAPASGSASSPPSSTSTAAGSWSTRTTCRAPRSPCGSRCTHPQLRDAAELDFGRFRARAG